MRTRSIPFWISAFIHFAVIGGAAILFIRPPEFAIDTGHNSVEVSLVAAAPDPAPLPPPVPVPQEMVETQPPKSDDLTVPVAPPTPPVPVPPPVPQKIEAPPPIATPPKPHRIPTLAKGDGSAPKPGKDAVTSSSQAGAIVDAKPDYLSNPPPVYPESARFHKQEGVVVLTVIVNEQGNPDEITIQTGSGFVLLDQSAVTAVRKWRFRPAALGNIQVKSRVVIPVRFRLE